MVFELTLVDARHLRRRIMAKINNAKFTPAAAGPFEIRFYAIDPNKREDFLNFYRVTLFKWLRDHHIDKANLSLIETITGSSLQVVFAASPPNSPPWDTFIELDGLEEFLLETKPVLV
jgi:hypothetical protein